MGAKVDMSKKPKGFRLMPEGETTLEILEVKGLPKANVKMVEVKFQDSEGIPLKNKYDLTNDGGYAAFYYLVTVGCGFDLDDEFDIDQLVGCFPEVEIIHREGSRPGANGKVPVFANIGRVTGTGTPFVVDGDESDSSSDEEWDD